MPVPIKIPDAPDGVYDRTHGWQSANDRVSYERAFQLDPVEQAKIQQALVTADPNTPQAAISASMTVPGIPAPPPPMDIQGPMDCFGPDLGHINDYAPSNFSGRLSEFSGSSIPSMPPW